MGLIIVISLPIPDIVVIVAYDSVLHSQPFHHPHSLKNPILHHELCPQLRNQGRDHRIGDWGSVDLYGNTMRKDGTTISDDLESVWHADHAPQPTWRYWQSRELVLEPESALCFLPDFWQSRSKRYVSCRHWGRGSLETGGNMSGTLKGQEPFTGHVSTRYISGTCVMSLAHFPYM